MHSLSVRRPIAGAASYTPSARRMGIASASAVVLLIAAYVVTLAFGMLTLSSWRDPIGDPWFSMLEALIILRMPFLISLMVAVHAWSPARSKTWSQLAIIFMAMLATLTCSIHFLILALGDKAEFSTPDGSIQLLSFKWPSIAYALDILAWDGFFALSVLCAAVAFSGSSLAAWIRALLLMSGVLALAGMSGVAFNDMRLRNIGIAGYAGIFPIAALLMAILFFRTMPVCSEDEASTAQE